MLFNNISSSFNPTKDPRMNFWVEKDHIEKTQMLKYKSTLSKVAS
nr:hypothetical protein [Mycoplasmopsis bovis]